ncbi:AAA family ATPase [Sphingobacterium yanglingense]|uniref:Exonuclease SbcC n=1 Tax=Sphingobacterium yanglingense TaxID=1437280 RepID=A0A4R6WK52_9SPHI|nr:AAA family ATPase [Sphingobacterium yanglingense]TDQ79082.1 exonuclease SbcC [Sphingobacterium yanglingense]
MLQLHKVYIQNFKGVYSPTIIPFDTTKLTILSGPNGFGKTTIFDAIELCLCGKIERTMTNNLVTMKNSGHKKPFYQHKAGEDVLIKVWLKDSDRNHIIVKRLDKASDGKIGTSRPFRPDSWEILNTYYSENDNDFESPPSYDNIRSIDQQFIDSLFFQDARLSMAKLYPLFNYLQQEDNIYFLKKDENSKKNELSFLFQTQKEDDELNNITEKLGLATSIRNTLKLRIEELGEVVSPNENIIHERLFEDKLFQFDEPEPFQNAPNEQLNSLHQGYQQIIQRLLSFARTFRVEEFEKQRLKRQLQSVISSPQLLESIVAQSLLREEPFNELQNKFQFNNRLKKYLDQLSNFHIDDDLNSQLGLGKDFNEALKQRLLSRQELVSQMDKTTVMLRQLNSVRQNTIQHFEAIKGNEVSPHHCPLCDSNWQSAENLLSAFEQKTILLSSFDQNQQEILRGIDDALETGYFSVIKTAVNNYLTAPENFIDQEFYLRISERKGNFEAIQRFMVIASNQDINFSGLILQQPVSLGKFSENTELVKTILENANNEIVVDESSLLDVELYEQYYTSNPKRLLTPTQLEAKLQFLNQKFNESKFFSLNILRSRLDLVENIINQTSSLKNQYAAVIKNYKKRMIEKIKIPFYIYSGKILQHYQQGYGIFIDVKDSTSRVRFLTSEDTDHDIIHQLSSGQLAVVSLAFCLALNKVYEAPNHFKFLAIDDPVQTLDDLNVHSFIELLRHEFIDYHLIISTHEEHIANYMLYKFGKFGFTNAKFNVQKIFYNNQLTS